MGKLQTLQSLTDAVASHGEGLALLAFRKDEAVRWHYHELQEQSRQLAWGLSQAGVSRGDKAALLASNSPVWIVACLAIIQTGAVVVPLDVQFDDDTLCHVLDDAAPRLIFATKEQHQRVKESVPDTETILLDMDDELSWRQWLGDEQQSLPELTPDDQAVLFYTSGTTGPPKGVPLTHENITFQIEKLAATGFVSQEDRVLQPLPMHHAYPLVIGTFTALAVGTTIVLPQSLTGQQIVRALNEGGVTLIIGVPRLYAVLYDAIQREVRALGRIASGVFKTAVWSSKQVYLKTGRHIGKGLLLPLHRRFGPEVRLLICGGSAIDPELARNLEAIGWQVGIGYGLTETAPLLSMHLPGMQKLESVGKPVDEVDLRIDTDVEGQVDAPGAETGEIQARGPNIFTGYHHLPEKTEEGFTEDGWFRTGDLGYFDDDDCLHVTGRVKTLIVTASGEKIQPDEIEEVYGQHPLIGEIGILQQDDQLVALVVPEMNKVQQQGDDIDHMVQQALDEQSEDLASYQRIQDYAVTRQPLPRTTLGKIQRHQLETRYKQAQQEDQSDHAEPMKIEEMTAEDHSLLEDEAVRRVWEWLTDRYSDRPLTPDTHLAMELGIDSLEWMDLTLEIERQTHVTLSDEAIAQVETIRDLLQAIQTQSEQDQETHAHPLEEPEAALGEERMYWLQPLSAPRRLLSRGLYAFNRGLIHSLFRLQVHGTERLPEQGPIIFAPNHTSYLDPFVVVAALGFERLLKTYWGSAEDVAFSNPLFRFVSRQVQAVPLNPRRAATQGLAIGSIVLQRGDNLIWFPEGQRSQTGELQPFKPGIGTLLSQYSATVLPVRIEGAYEALPPGRMFIKPVQIHVTFGEPLDAVTLLQQGEGDEEQNRIIHALRDRFEQMERFK